MWSQYTRKYKIFWANISAKIGHNDVWYKLLNIALSKVKKCNIGCYILYVGQYWEHCGSKELFKDALMAMHAGLSHMWNGDV